MQQHSAYAHQLEYNLDPVAVNQPTTFAVAALVPSDTSARVLRQVVGACAVMLARAAGTFVCNNGDVLYILWEHFSTYTSETVPTTMDK